MVAQPFGQGNALLADIREGMVVEDAAGERVGTVRRVFPGVADLDTVRRVFPGVADLDEVVTLGNPALDEVPDGLFAHLAKSGFVEIDAGPGRGIRYAAGEQVAALEGGGVRLSVGVDTLARK